ncbi:hypothetical protein LTR95_007020 [Oleoguttula sp. CCFEE 5521]
MYRSRKHVINNEQIPLGTFLVPSSADGIGPAASHHDFRYIIANAHVSRGSFSIHILPNPTKLTAMPPTILIVGATGNTGRSVVQTLPHLLQSSKELANHRVLGLTRSLKSYAAQELARLPHVEMVEYDWTAIDATWLRERRESGFYVALLEAGVKYVVKVLTNPKYVSPTNPVYYGRAHWAIETLLSQPEFAELQWTSLQPNYFTRMYLASAAEWVKQYRKTGNSQEVFKTNLEADQAVAMLDPEDVGSVGAHLLALDDPSQHNRARYVLSGPEDLTGEQLVALIEKYAGVTVANTEFKDVSWIDELSKTGGYPEKVLASIRAGCIPLWTGACSVYAMPTSADIIELAAPRRTPEVAFDALLKA